MLLPMFVCVSANLLMYFGTDVPTPALCKVTNPADVPQMKMQLIIMQKIILRLKHLCALVDWSVTIFCLSIVSISSFIEV